MSYAVLSLIVLFILLIAIAVFLIFFLYNTIKARGVPFVRSVNEIEALLLENIEIKKGQKFVDLGCGDGKILSAVSKEFQGIKAVGYETSRYPFRRAQQKIKQGSWNYAVIKQNFFKADLSDVDVVYCYLMPHLMGAVWKKLCQECKPGTLFYSNAFEIADIEAEKVYTRPSKNPKFFKRLFMYRVSEEGEEKQGLEE